MIRRVVTIASAGSLALCVAVLALWGRSGRVVADHVVLGMRDGRLWEWGASEGGVEVIAVPGFEHPAVAAHNVYPRGPGTTTLSICEIEWDPGSASAPSEVRCLGMEFEVLRARPALTRARIEWTPMARWTPRSGNVVLGQSATPVIVRVVSVPWWIPAAVTGAGATPMFVILARGVRRRRRRRDCRCADCGYDLRASTGRCPECGTPIPAETGEKA